MSKNDGGPAFPTGHQETYNQTTGLSLRDYFAAAAMRAYINSFPGGSPDYQDAPLWVPSAAYEMADAMLEERDK